MHCEYLKAAADHCISLGLSMSDEIKCLSVLLEDYKDPAFDSSTPMAGKGRKMSL